MTSSPLRSFMPITPPVARPIARASFSSKRTVWPLRDVSRTSSSPEVRRTPISSSPSRMLIAMMPSDLRGVSYSLKSVFLTMPSFVACTRYRPSPKSRVGDDRAHPLALAQRQQVDHGAAAALAVALGQLVHLQAVDLADAREEEDVVVRRRDEQVLDPVVVLGVHPHHAHAAALLLAVGGGRDALDVARLRDRDDHVLFADQLLEVELALGRHDLGAPVVAEAVAELAQLVLDDRVDARLVGQDRAQLGHERDELAVLACAPRPAAARSGRAGAGRGSPVPAPRRARTPPSASRARRRRRPSRGSRRSRDRGCRARSGSPPRCGGDPGPAAAGTWCAG